MNIRYLTIILMVFSALSCKSTSNNESKGTEGLPEAQHEIAPESVQEQTDAVSGATNVQDRPTFNGIIDVTPQNKATVSMTMGGIIHSLNVIPGRYVRKGEIIALIDNPDYINLQQDYLQISAQLDYLEAEYQRQSSLQEQNAVSQKAFQQSRADYLTARTSLMALQARLTTLGTDTETLKDKGLNPYLIVRAPIGGYVSNLDVNIGKYIDVGEPICQIVDKSNPILILTVYEKDLFLVQNGKKVIFKVNGLEDRAFEAEIVSIDQVVSNVDYSIKVYARVKEADASFRPGMYVRARID